MAAIVLALLIGGAATFAGMWSSFGLLWALVAAPFGGSLLAGIAAIALAFRNKARRTSEKAVAVKGQTKLSLR
ncbi:hypothetical protein [Microvirga flavescens]|uniref:hypothetical protein n=1 Tax=Microvirga flavescens TaxID=2249811 RepID=UPI00130090CB|nr:hypothetical protein [Microvirga flavescens]